MFAAAPLLALPVIGYNFLVFLVLSGGRHASNVARMAQPLFEVPTSGGGRWPVTLGDVIIFISLVVLVIEQLKSTTSRHIVIINQSLSMVLFIGCLVEFLIFQAFANSAFFFLTFMVLLDVVAGFILTIRQEMDLA
ncbi:MAG: hypothetical protein ACYDD1_14950 [Caulobacteraceae bacterium]